MFPIHMNNFTCFYFTPKTTCANGFPLSLVFLPNVQEKCLHQLGAAETVGDAVSQQVFEDKFIKKLKGRRGGQRRGFQVELSRRKLNSDHRK